ncbi:MAG: hypothetical protein U0166_21275 [Acidobacteriota bacterium]
MEQEQAAGSTAARWLEGRRFGSIVAAALVASSLPYLYRLARLPPGHRLLGGDFRNLGDIYTYVAWMKQAAQGHGLFMLLYDPTPQKRALFLPFFLVLGWIGRITRLDLMLVLHLARVASSALLMLAARWFCRTLLSDPGLRLRAFLLLTLGSGLPALIPEACPFSSMFDSALFAFSWVVILIAGGTWLRACREGSSRWAAITGACGATMLLVHPYDAVSLTALCVASTVVGICQRDPRGTSPRPTKGTAPGPAAGHIARLALVGLTMAPAAAIVLWSFAQNPRLRSWAGTPRPTAGWEVLSFGSLLILAGAAIAARRYRERGVDPLLVAWVASSLLLMFAPVPSQRRYIQGLMAPLAILGAHGFRILHGAGLRRLANHAFACAFPASAVMLVVDMSEIIPDVPRFYPAAAIADIQALEHLPDGVILAQPGIDYFVPPFSGRQVYAGHVDQTPDPLLRQLFFQDFAADPLCVAGPQLAAKRIRWILVDARMPSPPRTGVAEVRTLRTTRLLEVLTPPP